MNAIAIDGPVAAGKTSTAKLVASLLNIPAIRTGELFRALALCVLKQEFAESIDDMAALLQNGELEPAFVIDGRQQTGIIIHHHDPFPHPVFPSETLQNDPRLDQLASDLSKHPAIREALIDAERRIACERLCVMEGRDIGTVVIPDAAIKIYLTAGLDIRTDRRLKQRNLDPVQDFWPTLKAIRERDVQDMSRKTAPLRQAENALRLDNTYLTLNETAVIITALAKARGLYVEN